MLASAEVGQPVEQQDFWSWFYTNVSLDGVFNTLGLGILAVLFARDMILTKAQHERRVADIQKANDLRVADMEKAHEAEIAGWRARLEDVRTSDGERYSEMRESRDTYREAAEVSQTRNNELTDALVDANKGMAVSVKVLEALDTVVRERGT